MSETKKLEMYMSNLLVNSISKEELKEICQKAIEKYSPYNISNNIEIRPFRDSIIKETNFLPEKTSVSKRMYIIVNDYDYFYCKTCHQKMIDKKDYCSGKCKNHEKRVI